MSSPSLLTVQPRKWSHTPKRNYNLTHEVLPYEIEMELPVSVTLSIYSYLTPKYMQTPIKAKIERMSIELNHKMTIMRELIIEKKRRELIKHMREEERKKLVEKIDGLIKILEKIP